jgi:hypothetical protein
MTKLNRLWMTLFVLVLLSPLAARADSIEAQSIELDTRFSFDHNSIDIDAEPEDIEGSVTNLDMRVGVGYFFSSNWELLGQLLIQHYGQGGDFADVSTTDFGLLASGLYHFNTDGSFIPFIGLGLGFVIHGGDVDDDEDETTIIIPELVAGLRWPFRDVVSLNLSGGFRHEESPFGLEDAGGNDFFIAFGVSFFLRGGAVE